MSSRDAEELMKYMVNNYPLEAIFMSEITKHVSDIYQRLPTHENFQTGQTKDMQFQITKRKETEYAELKLSIDAYLFLSGMAKAISDVIVSEVLPNLRLENKQCTNCNTRNILKAKYCWECGEPFS